MEKVLKLNNSEYKPSSESFSNGYRVYFPGVERPGRGVNHPPPSSAKVKKGVEPYLYSPCWASWPVLG